MKKLAIIIAIILIIAVGAYFLLTYQGEEPIPAPTELRRLKVHSTAFEDGGTIPKKYTKDGQDLSPPISWTPPESTNLKTYLLIMFDPDAPKPPFVHWMVFNIPPNVTSLPEGVPKTYYVKGLGYQLKNGYGKVGYGGPYPPAGATHRYIFRIYALDSTLELGPDSTLQDLISSIKGRIIAYGELTGLYGR